jgi:hypothetical protein
MALSGLRLILGETLGAEVTVPEVGPLAITARNRDQADYLVRSRAHQRGVELLGVDVAAAGPGVWLVTVTVADADAARTVSAALDEDTHVMHFRNHPPRPRSGDG